MRGRVEICRFNSRLLADNPLGDPAEREVGVYLPPSYDSSTKRFPVVVVLCGYGSTGLALISRGGWTTPLDRRMDGLVARGEAEEAILVLPDCFTRYGGSQYVDSPAIGRYQSYLADELISFIDRRFRTIPKREARAVVGKSSGGYGALLFALSRPDLVAAVGSHAGDAAFDLSYRKEFGRTLIQIERHGGVRAFLEHFDRLAIKPSVEVEVLSNLCCAAAWSPTASGPYGYGVGFHLPFDLRTGELLDEVWARWRAWDPVQLVSELRGREALATMAAIYLDGGLTDEFNLQLGARQISDRLRAAKIAHIHEEFEGGHMNTPFRYDRSLSILTRALAVDS